jgi:predicted dehydrogenase
LVGEIFDIEVKVCVHTPWELWDFLKTKPRLEILYHSIHYLDLVRSFLGNPEKVYASTIKHPKVEKLAATRSSIILDYENNIQARVLTNHGHDYGLAHQESYLKIEGIKGSIKIKIGLSLDYPKGVPPKMEWMAQGVTDGWEEVELIGAWFPHAFIGTMATLQNHFHDRSNLLPISTEDALRTMSLVEAAYESSNSGGTLLSDFQ